MSLKYALIFALAALCCVVGTEAAAQRRNVVARDEIEDDGKTSVQQVEERQEQEEQEQEIEQEQAGKSQVSLNENRNTIAANNGQKATSNADDARARRVVRRGRRRGGNRRGGNRRGSRRRGGRRGRGGRRSNQIRRRVGRPVQG